MNKSLPGLIFLPVLLLTGLATAQAQHSLIGITRFASTLQHSRHAPCGVLPTCVAAGLPPTTSFIAGGTAFDGTENLIWVTTGQQLAAYDFGAGCAVVCPPIPCPKSAATANASGLDVVESLGELWVVDDAGALTRCTLGCPPAINGICNIALLPGDIPTGVTVDDGRGVVFYSTVSPIGSRIYVAQMSTPCTPFFSTMLLDCALGAVPASGIAVDWGNSTIYWTDGPSTYSFSYTYNSAGPSIAFSAQTCCPFVVSPNQPYNDLAMLPRRPVPAGNPCANGSCPPCLSWHSLRNAPILGNTVELGLDDAPEASFSWCLLDIGVCTTGAPAIPPMCGPLLTGGTFALGFNITSGVTGCNGSTTFTVSLPLIPAFAGLPLASQCVTFCPGGVGTALSNCQSWMLLGS